MLNSICGFRWLFYLFDVGASSSAAKAAYRRIFVVEALVNVTQTLLPIDVQIEGYELYVEPRFDFDCNYSFSKCVNNVRDALLWPGVRLPRPLLRGRRRLLRRPLRHPR